MPELLGLLVPILGKCRVVADCTWPEWREATVLEVIDADGVRWFAKRHRGADKYRRELTAYRRWVPALGHMAPTLRGFDDAAHLLVVSALPGANPGGWGGPDLLAQAGRLLQALHNSDDLGIWDDMVADKQAELDYWLRRWPGLIERRAVDFVRSELTNLQTLPPPPLVPCHGDFSPRNWLVSEGQLGIIDFGEAGPDMWVSDLGRLLFGWRLPPEELDALLEGYGRRPDDNELVLLRASYAAAVVWHIIWGHEHRNHKFESASRRLLGSFIDREFG